MKKTFRKTLSVLLALIMVVTAFPASALIGAGAELFTVSFDADGGLFPDGTTMYTVRAEYGSKLEVPEPTLEGHTFCGWYPYAPETVEDDATYYATWEINEYTVTYIVDGEVYEEYPVWFDDEVDMPADPYFDDGRTFLGWSETEGSEEIAEIPEFMPSKNLTYYAVWDSEEYTVTFYGYEALEASPYKSAEATYEFSVSSVEPGEMIMFPDAPDNINELYFTFIGWSETEGGAVLSDAEICNQIMPSEDVSYYAVYERVKVMLVPHYFADYWKENELTCTTVLDRAGKSVDDYNPDSDTWYVYGLDEYLVFGYPDRGEDAVETYITVSGDGYYELINEKATAGVGTGTLINVYDNFTGELVESLYIIVYGDLDGDSSIDALDHQIVYDEANGETSWSDPTSDDYAPYMVKAADMNADGIIDYLDAAVIQNVVLGVFYIDQITGKWDDGYDTAYTISYYTEETLYVLDDAGFYSYGETIELPEIEIADGYELEGWYDYKTNEPVPGTMPENDLFVYAKLREVPKKYDLVFNENSGSKVEDVLLEAGEEFVLPVTSKDGYIFLGWTDGETVYQSGSVFVMPECDVELVAVWEVEEYTVTFYVNGEVYESYNVLYGQKIDIPEDPFLAGFTFMGWSEGGIEVVTIPEYMPAKNLEYHAIWEWRYNIITGVCGDNLTWSLNTDTGELVISGTGDMYDWEYSSPAPWNDYSSDIKTVTIGDGATSIGAYAFCSCNSLTSVAIGNGVTSIGESAFEQCTGLTDLTIGNSVTDIGAYAFASCESLTNVVIPDSVTTIGDCAFHYCTGLTDLTIGNNVTSIGEKAFFYCDSLLSVIIPDSVENIGDYAFYDCSGLVTVKIGNGVTNISSYMFSLCIGLTDLTIGSNVTSISNGAFYGCENLTDVIIPDSVTSIGCDAFSNCDSLVNLTIGNSVESIGNNAFFGCASLTSITIPDSVTTIEYNAFNFTGLYNNNSNWEDNVLYIGKFLIEAKPENNVSCTVKEGTKVIADSAFLYCENLKTITIPASVTNIGDSAFYNCNNMKDVYYDGMEAEWNSIDIGANNECLTNATTHFTEGYYTYTVDKNGNATITDVDNGISGEVIVPETLGGHPVTSIGWMAFEDCDSMWKVIIAGNVTNIDNSAFVACDRLDTVVIGDSVTDMGACAFDSCHRLTSVTIGENVKKIGEYTFYDCTSLTSIVIPDSVTEIGWNAFENCTGLKTVIIGDGVTKIDRLAFKECNAIEYVSLGNNISTIGKDAFSPCYGLKEADYNGTRAEWEAVEIYSGNGRLELLIRCIDDEEETTTEPTTVPVVTEPSTTEPTTAPVVTEPSTTEPTTEPEVTEPSTTEPTTEPEVTEPSTTEPTTEPEVTEPSSTEPTTEPEVTEPSTTEPTTVPVVTEPSTTEPTTEPEVTEPSTTEPTTEPEVTEPSTTEPTTVPVVTEPSTTEPTTEPEVTEPSTTEPTTEPEETEPSETNSDVTVSIRRPSTTTVKYGETLILHAEVRGEMPENAKLEWSVEGEGVTIAPSADGRTCAVTSTANGEVTITVRLVDADGEAVSNPEGGEITARQQLTSKAGFFQKLISFFKNLFRLNRVIEQVFKFAL